MTGPARTRDLTWLVALSSALWGTDALLRKPLTTQLPTPLIVVLEHAVCVAILSPLLPRAWRGWRRLTGRQRLAMIGVGAGASALATTLFTLAFTKGDAITPLVLQKLQPLFAIGLAGLLLGERLHRRYLLFVVPALAGAWLLTFPDPLHVGLASAEAALLAVGAAALWAGGTVLGRLVSAELDPTTLTVLRFAIGLPTAVLIALATGTSWRVAPGDWPAVVALALIPGLLALLLYYRGLRRTPASRATLAELAFPATAALVGVFALGDRFAPTQWLGVALVVAAVTALGVHERSAAGPAVVTGRLATSEGV
ncbi:EamA family transporter [Actinocatenispora thailandica]|uniref:EamA family transporter n=1 Tax=Actinocatenispora thailandica TaxID=227318 RepID=A0A7R7HWM0_9ACTN|nr:DMT family transporter [Actinocatenispora thailandica]BCJ35227.1 EamA family transporter [Actinocatenispora thailandica]